ncbi:MAG: alpha/beta fold hydrolase [Hyphomonadaceae bacterium]|nr:alpha/beta fold hydrolase [Hyphomonadaceae bacterium]
MSLMLRIALSFVVFACTIVAERAEAQTLPRRSQLGAGVAAGEGGVTVTAVAPNSPAARAGLSSGDLIQRVGATPVATPADFVAAVRAARPGRATPFAIVRDGAPTALDVTLIEAPRENVAGLQTSYGAVEVAGALRRTLVTAPAGRANLRRPAVLIVQGIGCYSIDDSTPVSMMYARLAHDLARAGIVVMRVDKSGMGDSQGPACNTVDFDMELAGYAAALQALRADRRVDPDQIFVFGHSIGAIGAPRLAAAQPVAGVIAAQGAGVTWMEYSLINIRRQLELGGASPAEVDAALIVTASCSNRILLNGEPVQQVIAQTPDCANLVPMPMSQAYMRQLTDINMAGIWGAFRAPTLLIYGESDYVTNRADHERLAAIVNAGNPGAAEVVLLPGVDHYLAEAETQAASMQRLASGNQFGTYAPQFSAAVSSWICARASCRP